MTQSSWQFLVVDTSIINLSLSAQAWVQSWLDHVSKNPDFADQVPGLSYVQRSGTYSNEGRLERTQGPHLSLGTHYRADIPANKLVEFLGDQMYLQIDPFQGEQVLRGIDIWLEGRLLLATFDPPAPPVPERSLPKLVNPSKPWEPKEKDE